MKIDTVEKAIIAVESEGCIVKYIAKYNAYEVKHESGKDPFDGGVCTYVFVCGVHDKDFINCARRLKLKAFL